MIDADIIRAAEYHHSIGLNVLPVGNNKRPLATRWKRFQSARMPLRELVDALERPDARGIGLITGRGGGLYVRDFDDLGAFDAWSNAHADLAATLPCERTSRGTHVFALWPEPVATRKLASGELRGERAFTVIAPSFHPSGRRYEWVRPIVSLVDVPTVNPAWFVDVPTRRDREDREIEETEIQRPSLSLCYTDVDEAIRQTQPEAAGQRDAMLFKLARILRPCPATPTRPRLNWNQCCVGGTSRLWR